MEKYFQVTGRKKLPIGIEHFREIRTEGFYYVDKTGFIRDLLTSWGKVNLFTRPRRFGKSLNMDMLKEFFEYGADASLFQTLEIGKETELCREYLGQFPVISISLKSVGGSTYEKALDNLGSVIQEEARRLQFLLESEVLSAIDKKVLAVLYEDSVSEKNLTRSLKLLSEMLFKHYGKRVIILIDEYDVPLDKAYANGYYGQMVEQIRALFEAALKTNHNLHFAVLTGCLRIARESIFTGLNNFKVRTISDVDYAEYFGFTDAEVRQMLSYYGLEECYGSMKEWYDGYHFGQVEVYCPWDVINQCDKLCIFREAEPEPHWANSSSNAIVQSIMEQSTATTRDQIEALISGEVVEKELIPELTFTDLDSEDEEHRQTYLWSVLAATGYLTEVGRAKNGLHRLAIPNLEVRNIFENKIRTWFRVKVTSNTARWKAFCEAVQKGEAEQLQTIYNGFLSESISVRDSGARRGRKESFYHGMLLGMLQAEGTWIVKSNLESGVGYTDILLEIPAERIGCIIETKYAENGTFDAACQEAIKQIEEMDYAAVLRENGMNTIHGYGVACYKKECRVRYKRIQG